MRAAALVFAASLVATSCSGTIVGVSADRGDIELRVLPDGDVEVSEVWMLRGETTSMAQFARRPPAGGHDGVMAATSSLDQTSREDVREYRFSYRARHAVAVDGLRGRLEWTALGHPRPRMIREATIRVRIPAGSIVLGTPGIAESGWHVTQAPEWTIATRADVPAEARGRVALEFSIEHLEMPRPVWQFQQARAAEFAPAFIAAGLFILVVGAGVIVMVWFRFRAGASAIAGEAEREADRRRAIRDLGRTGGGVIVAGLVMMLVTIWLPGGLGPWSFAIAASVVADGVMFLAWAAWHRPLVNPAGPDRVSGGRRESDN